MNTYTISSFFGFILFGMGLLALLLGFFNYKENKGSKTGRLMLNIFGCVFLWNFGYAWMSLCFYDDFAYVPRAIALLAVTMYMLHTLLYVSEITHYPQKILRLFMCFFMSASVIAWFFIIQKSTVSFEKVFWGYWYTGTMTWARVLQFACIIAAIIFYYIILNYGIKNASLQRELFILKRFKWFGPVLFTGYLFDTLLPILFHTAAIPGSCISAFFSAMLLYNISKNNKTFGISKDNVSQYVFKDVVLPIIIEDAKGEVILLNSYSEKYFECREKEMIGCKIDQFFDFEHPFSSIQEEKENSKVSQNNGKDKMMVRVLGKENICKLTKSTVQDRFGDLLYTIYFIHDVTKEQNTLTMLEESRKIAEEASMAKSNFMANMSHEIRTPMNAIIGMSDIIIHDETITEQTKFQALEIQIAGKSLLGIINDILDISKIESGDFTLQNEPYEFASLIHDVSNIIRIKLQETNVSFSLSIDPTIPHFLLGDITRVRQILLNILGNATKFTKEGSISLQVDWDKDENTPSIFFHISDTGIGMKPEDQEKVFEIFSQVDTRKNRSIQGTGLGLSISKKLCNLMDGDITLESEFGKGSTFHIMIKQKLNKYTPMGETIINQLADGKYIAQLETKQQNLRKRPDCKVLIVDDNAVNLKVASALMKRYALQIDTASSGKEAISKVQERDYDIIFMDHMMPEMDGVDTTRAIRTLGEEKYKNQVIIALSANALVESQELFKRETMQDFLAKPIDKKKLDEILNKWLP